MPKNRILITGATGLLGPYLMDTASKYGDAIGTGRRATQHSCDLTSLRDVEALIADVTPDMVIHAAAMTNVDWCEKDPKTAFAINGEATENLAKALPSKVRMIYISTDQVYPDQMGPHAEEAAAPINVYGSSKLAGENSVVTRPGSLVVRTNIFGATRTSERQSLSDFVLDNIAGEKPFTLFEDSFFSPLHMSTLATLIFELIDASATSIVNLGSRSGMSKKEFGLAVARQKELKPRNARFGRSSDMPNRAPRPSDLRLDVTRAEMILGRKMPQLEDEIRKL